MPYGFNATDHGRLTLTLVLSTVLRLNVAPFYELDISPSVCCDRDPH